MAMRIEWLRVKQEMIGWSPGPDTEFFPENMI